MTQPLDKQIEIAKKRAELARLKRDAEADAATTKLIKDRMKVRAEYDSLEQANGAKRKGVKKQRCDTDSRITPRKRMTGAEIGRHLHENTSSWRSIMHQFKVAAVGATGPKLQVNTGRDDDDGSAEAWGRDAARWFNGNWAKWCDQVDDTHLVEQVAMCMQYIKREGDVLCIFDDFNADDGRLRWVEATQILGMDEKDWEAVRTGLGFPDTTCDNGIIRDESGVVLGYLFTNEHGKQKIEMDMPYTALARYDARRNPTGSARLIKSPWRFNQHRGEADALAVSDQIQDIYEMLAAELQTAKKSSQIAGWVELDKDADGALQGVIRALQQSGKTAAEIDALINGDGTNPGAVGVTYDSLEGLTGGKWEYMQPGEKPVFHDPSRPNMSITEFCDAIQVSTGASMGVGRARSTMKAETSYTAFRGEELMSWQTFEWEQKLLERRLMDFLAVKAITWGTTHDEISPDVPDGWESTLSFVWPKMREVDEMKAGQGVQYALKNGTTDYSKVLGPDWRDKFKAYGEQLDAAREEGLPLTVFETTTGAVIEDTAPEETEDPQTEDMDNEE